MFDCDLTPGLLALFNPCVKKMKSKSKKVEDKRRSEDKRKNIKNY